MANESPKPLLPINIPGNYPTVPAPGKIAILFGANKHDLYHRLSPYGYDTFLGIKTRQPFMYAYPDEGRSTPGITDQFTRAITDVQRVSKWMISQSGIIFLTKQFLMQTGNAFNETRIYNPTSPIVAAGLPLTLWTGRPMRHIDTSDLLGSFLGGLGRTIGGLFGVGNKPPQPPAGTVGIDALPTNNAWGGKGLLRAGTANKAKTVLTSKWIVQSPSKVGVGQYISNTLKTIFGNFLPQRQQADKRSDELTYGLMLGSSTGNTGVFSYQGSTMFFDGVQQYWFGGENGKIRYNNQIPLNWKKIYIRTDGINLLPELKLPTGTLSGERVGYQVGAWDKPVKYGDFVGNEREESLSSEFKGSDILVQHSMYVDEGNQYPSKQTRKITPSVQSMRASLERVINQIRNTIDYTVETNPQSSVLMFNQEKIGYDRIAAMRNQSLPTPTGKEPAYSVLKEYRERKVRAIEDQFTDDGINLSMKMASTGKSDHINNLEVMDGDFVRKGDPVWKPYRDDIIAFYFYDLVNDKYIPFRATIRGLQETDSTNWEELSFIGRGDRLYSYSGFNRSLSFAFTVHINSISELSPTWQRISYLMSLVKPANYTAKKDGGLYTRFIVPPMVTVTIGDLYRNQPVVLASAGIAIPDGASWETMNEDNSTEWSYLAGYIKAPDIEKRYGQMPRTADISINCYVLEKERAIAGAAHFGHAPHTEEYVKNQYRETQPDFSKPTEFHKSLVVYQKQKSCVKP